MPNKLAYIYACDVFIKICFRDGGKKKKKRKKKSGNWPPLLLPRLWKSVQVTEPLDQHQKIRHLAQKTAYLILLKSDDKCSSPLKTNKPNKHGHEWLSSSFLTIKLVDEISQSKSADEAWFQRCSGARLFHNVMLLKDICLSLETRVVWRGAVGLYYKKKKEKKRKKLNLHSPASFLFFVFPLCCCCCWWWWCRSAQSHWGENAHWKSTG